MKTNLKNKLIMGLSAAMIVLSMSAASVFADRGDRGGRDGRGDRVVNRDRDGWQGDRDGSRGNRNEWRGDRDRYQGRVNYGWYRPVYVYRPYTYYPVYSAPVYVTSPYVCQPAYSSVSFFFGW